MTDQTPAPPPTEQRGIGTAMGGVFLGLVIAAMGALFCWGLWVGYTKARVTDSWLKTPCHIVQSEVEEFKPTPNSPFAYRFLVEYKYTIDGTTYTSRNHRRPRRNDETTKHQKKAEALVKKYPAGSDSVCFVDPENPEMAVLKRDSKAVLYTIWFPALFVVGGLGIAAGFIRKGRKSHAGA